MRKFINYFVYNINRKLRVGFINSAGRNNTGKICVFHRSGGYKHRSYLVDFYRRINCSGFLLKIIKTKYYSSFLGFILYENGYSNYIIISDNNKIGDKLYSGIPTTTEIDCKPGYALPLKNISLFTLVNNIELSPYRGITLNRAAGSCCIITSKLLDKVSLKLKSGWNLELSNKSICCIGITSNSLNAFNKINKAGISRSLGLRPVVRGVAMNPCDHPHGGGEGKKSGSVTARSPWGKLCKGTPSKIKKYQLLYKKKFKNLR